MVRAPSTRRVIPFSGRRAVYVGGQGRQHRRVAEVEDGLGHLRADVGAAGDLDLMLERGLDQQPHQVVVVEQRAAGDDRAGDLDVVQGEDVDQGLGRPIGVRDALGQPPPDGALRVQHQGHEQVVDDPLGSQGVVAVANPAQFAKAHDVHQQTFAVGWLPTLGKIQ